MLDLERQTGGWEEHVQIKQPGITEPPGGMITVEELKPDKRIAGILKK